ncbi:ATP-binding protein [Niabella ginsengisoli]|uniref:ATP-binding protein n=1 Tax=Niabella ginsengisoli TaxID=522298 RepID=UPI00374C9555
MRYLSKIIMIESANVRYTEVNLDGNVHLTGTQGVGKSTLLRALLFSIMPTSKSWEYLLAKKPLLTFTFLIPILISFMK